MEKLNILNKRLREVAERYKQLKESGIDEDILICYLKDKTKLSQKKIKELLEDVDEFYSKLIGKAVAEEI